TLYARRAGGDGGVGPRGARRGQRGNDGAARSADVTRGDRRTLARVGVARRWNARRRAIARRSRDGLEARAAHRGGTGLARGDAAGRGRALWWRWTVVLRR